MGSGTLIRRSIAKHGVDNHSREILLCCKSRLALKRAEAAFVNESTLLDCQCLNILVGGVGGFSPEATQRGAINSVAKRASLRADPEWANKTKKAISEGCKTSPKMAENREARIANLRKAKPKYGRDNKNFGKKLINKDGQHKRVPIDSVEAHLSLGWALGATKKVL